LIRHRNQSYPGEHEAIIPQDLWEKVQNQLRSDNGGRRNGIKANCTTMLAGLLQDVGGNLFHSSHTVKNDKRYRYYFSSTTVDSGKQTKAIRLPAYDVEKHVSLRLQSFLGSPNDVMKSLTLPEDHPETIQKLMRAAKNQAEEWALASPAALGDFVRKVVWRVVVHPEKMDLEISRSELRGVLMNERLGVSGRTEAQQEKGNPDDLVCLGVKARLRRWGGQMRLVLSPDSQEPEMMVPIVKAVVQAHKWRQGVLAGDQVWVEKGFGRKPEYLRRVLSCAFLAPDIVEAILDGRQPAHLTAKKLSRRRLPLDWAEQRIQFGFACTQ
jgi:site-specific DNA recombinase